VLTDALQFQKLVQSLSQHDYQVNVGVLETAHSIFRPWRADTRSDALFTTINYVLSRFSKPFLQMLLHTSNLLFSSPSPPNLALIAQTQAILIDIFFDLTAQDLPPDFEDAHFQFFGPDGLFLKFLAWNPTELVGDVRSSLYLTFFCVFFYQILSLMIRHRHYLHELKLVYLRSQR
jgi:exportin-2 (importin alpha re-exporter)